MGSVVTMDDPIYQHSVVTDMSVMLHTVSVQGDATPITFSCNDNTTTAPWSFGIVRLQMAAIDITTAPQFILFTVDRSGSMEDMSNKKHTKMHYVIHTLENMFRYIAKFPETSIYIRIDAFDSALTTVIETTLVRPDNIDILIEKVRTIRPRDETDIGLALDNANQVMRNYASQHPDHTIHHIFLTDGDATKGEQRTASLVKKVTADFPGVYIGIGKDHNSTMLQYFTQTKGGDYRFIDNSENAGMVYGEVLHSILRPAIEHFRIVVMDGEIYDWQTNTWSTTYSERLVESEANKTYHLRTRDPGTMSITIHGIVSTEKERGEQFLGIDWPLPDLETFHGEVETIDLTVHLFRQRVLELLYECRHVANGRGTTALKQRMSTLFRQMRRYMRKCDLMVDPFMRTLCEDIAVTYHSLGTRYASMYCSARQSSQGRQDTYTVAYDDEEEYAPRATSPPRLTRQHCYSELLRDPPPTLLFPAIETAETNEYVSSPEEDVPSDIELTYSGTTIQSMEIDDEIEDQDQDEDSIENYRNRVPSEHMLEKEYSAYSTPRKLDIMRSLHHDEY